MTRQRQRWTVGESRTALTGVVCLIWAASFIIRWRQPESVGQYAALDTIVITVIGYWFTKRGAQSNGRHDGSV